MYCKLCKQHASLRESHIIPEFFYKLMYDSKNRIFVISSSPDKKVELIQKGIREPLLCGKCEQLLSVYENYAKQLLFGSKFLKIDELEKTQYSVKLGNVDYKKFKLFQMSILWRAGISKKLLFKNIKLGPHEEILRKMILNHEPGEPHQYGCLIVALSANGGLLDVINSPSSVYCENHLCYRFIFGGFLWVYFVSKHSFNFTRKQWFLNKEGELLLIVDDAIEYEFIRKQEEHLKRRKNDVIELNKKISH